MRTRDVFRKARKLLETDGWGKGKFFELDIPSGKKYNYCVRGALRAVAGPYLSEDWDRVIPALNKVIGIAKFGNPADWNDAPNVKKEHVLNALKMAEDPRRWKNLPVRD
jgi:hypothetical protein